MVGGSRTLGKRQRFAASARVRRRRGSMFEKGLLQGKRVLITGGGSGLGRSIGARYLALGADLVICGRREAVLKETAQAFAADLDAEVETHVCDVRSAEAVEAIM